MTRMRALLVSVVFCAAWNSTLFAQLRTRAERTNYAETSRYEDVVDFLNTVTNVVWIFLRRPAPSPCGRWPSR
jgi:hypothetical protein